MGASAFLAPRVQIRPEGAMAARKQPDSGRYNPGRRSIPGVPGAELTGPKVEGYDGKAGRALRRALLDHVPEMVTVSDRRGRIVYANPATERVSGYAPEEFVERHPFDTIHPEDRPAARRPSRGS